MNIREQNGILDAKTKLVKALAAGAVATLRPNRMGKLESQTGIDNSYYELKEMIRERYPQVDVDVLDIGPGSAERQKAIASQIEDVGVVDDEEILYQAQLVLNAIAKNNPEVLWASSTADPAPQHT